MVTLSFHRGTLLLEGDLRTSANFGFVWDDRIGKERTEALWYRDLLQHLHDSGVSYQDDSRAYLRLPELVLVLQVDTSLTMSEPVLCGL